MRSLCLLLLALTPVLGADILTVATDNGCGKIVALIRSAGLEDALKAAQGVTLFAPNDAAVDAIPADVLLQLQTNATLLASVLKFHVVSFVARKADIGDDPMLLPTLDDGGAELRINVYTNTELVYHSVSPAIDVRYTKTVVTAEGAEVLKTDLEADNGVVHVLDKVIYPLPALSLPLTLTFDPQLSNLAYLIYEANLTDALAVESFTVFAPSTDVLDKLDGQLYNDLLMNKTRLTELLFGHVVKGVFFSKGLYNGQQLTTLQGTRLTVAVGAGGVQIDQTNVIRADIPAVNGVIHVIDAVIMPTHP